MDFGVFDDNWELLEALAKASMKTKDYVSEMLHNVPFTPWFIRRNEVSVEIEIYYRTRIKKKKRIQVRSIIYFFLASTTFATAAFFLTDSMPLTRPSFDL